MRNRSTILPAESNEEIDGRVIFQDTPRGRKMKIKGMAKCMIDVLSGTGFRSARGPIEPFHDEVDLPYGLEIPTVAWSTQEIGSGVAGEVLDTGTVTGSLGDLYSASFPDQTSSMSFNTGFYAGVLAARNKLVSIEEFETESVSQMG